MKSTPHGNGDPSSTPLPPTTTTKNEAIFEASRISAGLCRTMRCSHAALCCRPLIANRALRTAFSLSYLQGVINKRPDGKTSCYKGGEKNTAVKKAGFQSKCIQRIVWVLYGRMLCLLMNIQKEPFCWWMATMDYTLWPQAGGVHVLMCIGICTSDEMLRIVPFCGCFFIFGQELNFIQIREI